jgi:hypothetical protein
MQFAAKWATPVATIAAAPHDDRPGDAKKDAA